jgi:hypothetical protein
MALPIRLRPRPKTGSRTEPVFDPALVALEQRIARLEALMLPLDEPAFLARLAASTHGAIFSTRELLEHARIDRELAGVLSPLSAKQLGQRLKALADGRPRGPFLLERVLRERGGWLWRVTASD